MTESVTQYKIERIEACVEDKNALLYMVHWPSGTLWRIPRKRLRPEASVCHWLYVKYADTAISRPWNTLSMTEKSRRFVALNVMPTQQHVLLMVVNQKLPFMMDMTSSERAIQNWVLQNQSGVQVLENSIIKLVTWLRKHPIATLAILLAALWVFGKLRKPA